MSACDPKRTSPTPSSVHVSVDTIRCFSLGVSVKRREFIGLLGGAAAASPLAAWAQGSQLVRRVSMLLGLDEKDPETNSRVRAFRLGMRDLGWVEGRNVQIEYRFAGTKLESINKHVAEVIGLAPDVIVARSEEHTSELQSLRHLV